MRTFKKLALNNFLDVLRHYGSVKYLDTSLDMSIHKLFREKYRKSSKRKKRLFKNCW